MALSVKSIRRLKITSITVASLTLVYTLLGFFVLPLVVEHYLVSITKDKTDMMFRLLMCRLIPLRLN